jgi:hypothetical protein
MRLPLVLYWRQFGWEGTMLRLTLRYARYAFTALASVGFKIATN